MKVIDPIRIILYGDRDKAASYIGVAKQKMNILLSEAAPNNLAQHIKRYIAPDGTTIVCTKAYNNLSVHIESPFGAPVVKEEAQPDGGLFVVFGYRRTIDGIDEYGEATKIYRHYSTTYQQREIENIGSLKASEQTDLKGPTDKKYTSDVNEMERDLHRVGREWSKTYEHLTVTAYVKEIITISDPPGIFSYWGISAIYRNKPVNINGDFDFPKVGGFLRAYDLGYKNDIFTVNFDIGKDRNGVYKIGVMEGENDNFYEFSLIDGEFVMTDSSQSTIRNDLFPDNEEARDSLKIIGFGYIEQDDTWYAYWANYGWHPYYYKLNVRRNTKETISGEDPDSTDGGSLCASVWNPITRVLTPFWSSYGAEEAETIVYEAGTESERSCGYVSGLIHGSPVSTAGYDANGNGTGYGVYEPYYPKHISYQSFMRSLLLYGGAGPATVPLWGGPSIAVVAGPDRVPDQGLASTMVYRSAVNGRSLGKISFDDVVIDKGRYELLTNRHRYLVYLIEVIENPGDYEASSVVPSVGLNNSCRSDNGQVVIHVGNNFNPAAGPYNPNYIFKLYSAPITTLGACTSEDQDICIIACKNWSEGGACYPGDPPVSVASITKARSCSSQESVNIRLTPPPYLPPGATANWCSEPDGEFQTYGYAGLDDYLEEMYPWDRSWRAILLRGQTRSGDEVIPMVVFEKDALQGPFDEAADGYPRSRMLCIDQHGNKWILGDELNRVFFVQKEVA